MAGASATLGGSGSQVANIPAYEDYFLDFGSANGGVPVNLATGANPTAVQLVSPFNSSTQIITGTFGSSGVNPTGFADDGNGRMAIQMGGGLVSGGVTGGSCYGINKGLMPQLLKPTSASAVSAVPIDMQAWLIDWWLQFGPLGAGLQRGDCGTTFQSSNSTPPDLNCIHNVNTGGVNQTGGVQGFGLLYFVDGNLHLFSNIGGTGTVPGLNQIISPPPADIVRISWLIQQATLTSNAILTLYLNRVAAVAITWVTGAGRPLPLYTDMVTRTAFAPQAIATPPGQDAQAHLQSGYNLYGFRWRKGPTLNMLASI
jgi:hypothetical protein